MILDKENYNKKSWEYYNESGTFKNVPVSKNLRSFGKVDHYAIGSKVAKDNFKKEKAEKKKDYS